MGILFLQNLTKKLLKRIAIDGNGKYFRGTNYEDHLDKIYTELSELEQTEFGVKKVTDYEDRFYLFLDTGINSIGIRIFYF